MTQSPDWYRKQADDIDALFRSIELVGDSSFRNKIVELMQQVINELEAIGQCKSVDVKLLEKYKEQATSDLENAVQYFSKHVRINATLLALPCTEQSARVPGESIQQFVTIINSKLEGSPIIGGSATITGSYNSRADATADLEQLVTILQKLSELDLSADIDVAVATAELETNLQALANETKDPKVTLDGLQKAAENMAKAVKVLSGPVAAAALTILKPILTNAR